jgi:hypothetical protein
MLRSVVSDKIYSNVSNSEIIVKSEKIKMEQMIRTEEALKIKIGKKLCLKLIKKWISDRFKMSFYTFDIKNLLKVIKRMKLIKQFQKNLINWQKNN